MNNPKPTKNVALLRETITFHDHHELHNIYVVKQDITLKAGTGLNSSHHHDSFILELMDIVPKDPEQYKHECLIYDEKNKLSNKQDKLRQLQNMLNSTTLFGSQDNSAKIEAIKLRIEQTKNDPKIPADRKPLVLKNLYEKVNAFVKPLASNEDKQRLIDLISLLEKEIELLQAIIQKPEEALPKKLFGREVISYDGKNFVRAQGQTMEINGKTFICLDNDYCDEEDDCDEDDYNE